MPQLDAISFLFVLFVASTLLFGVVIRHGYAKTFRLGDSVRFGLFWAVFVTVVLVMNQAGRETLDPGRWPNERLFQPLVKGEVQGLENPAKNLLLGWCLFPLRTFPLATVRVDAIVTGVMVLAVAVILIELLGRTLVSRWRIQWTAAGLACFLLLDLMTYSTVGLVRQISWIFA